MPIATSELPNTLPTPSAHLHETRIYGNSLWIPTQHRESIQLTPEYHNLWRECLLRSIFLLLLLSNPVPQIYVDPSQRRQGRLVTPLMRRMMSRSLKNRRRLMILILIRTDACSPKIPLLNSFHYPPYISLTNLLCKQLGALVWKAPFRVPQ